MFQYPEEKDPSYWLRYINEDKSRHMAEHGRPMPPMEIEKKTIVKETSEGAIVESCTAAAPDIELGLQGREEKIVDWDGPDDPEVST